MADSKLFLSQRVYEEDKRKSKKKRKSGMMYAFQHISYLRPDTPPGRVVEAIERDIGPGPPGWMERQRERKTVQLGNIPRHSLRFKMILYGEYECAPRDQELTAEDLTFRSLDDDQPFQLSPLFSSSSDHPQHFTEIMCFRNDEIIATIKMIPQTGAIEIAEHTPVQVVEV